MKKCIRLVIDKNVCYAWMVTYGIRQQREITMKYIVKYNNYNV
jgi:recombinational DNA repair protein RecT